MMCCILTGFCMTALAALFCRPRKPQAFILALAGVAALSAGLGTGGWEWYRAFCRYVCGPLAGVLLLAVIASRRWAAWGRRLAPQVDRSRSFSLGKTLVIVPHQDDEVLLAGGVLPEIAARGEVFILFSTNGNNEDEALLKGMRLGEAQRAAAKAGIPADHVLFLGFGNDWKPSARSGGGSDCRHLWNAGDDDVMTSAAGDCATWAPPGVRCFRSGVPYARRHFVRLLGEAISEVHPDTLICVDYDAHADHRALSLAFEECMGELLRREPDWRPFILKGFCYNGTWNAPRDFYADNIVRTLPSGKEALAEHGFYRWEERLRLPVCDAALTRVQPGNIIYEMFMCHESQALMIEGVKERMINGDKVFWHRPTGNALLRAKAGVSSGQAEPLHDFRLMGSRDVADADHLPLDHGWFPDGGRGRAWFELEKPMSLARIRLYAVPDPSCPIDAVRLELSNGKTLETGPLPTVGHLDVDTGCTEELTGFSLEITAARGSRPGLAEVEAYETPPRPPIRVVKLQDEAGNFVYDDMTPPDGEARFSLYVWPKGDGEESGFRVSAAWDDGRESELAPRDGVYRLTLPRGRSAEVRVYREGKLEEAARFSNPSRLVRMLFRCQRRLDKVMKAAARDTMRHYFHYLALKLARGRKGRGE